MKESPALPVDRSGPWAKHHCDYLLDSIDAQLSQLQVQGPDARPPGGSGQGMGSLDAGIGTSSATDLGERSRARARVASPEEDLISWNGEDPGWLVHLLDSEGPPGDPSRSDSVCTEDLAAMFHEGLVEPLLSSDEEVLPVVVLPSEIWPVERSAWNGPGNASGPQAFVVCDSACPVGVASKEGAALLREEAPEGEQGAGPPARHSCLRVRRPGSLGEGISRLSQKCSDETSGATGLLRDGPSWERLLSSAEKPVGLETEAFRQSAFMEPGRKGLGDSLEQVQDTSKNSDSPLLVEDLGPLQLLQAANVGTAVSDGGLLGSGLHEPQCGLIKEGWMKSFRTKYVAAAGQSTKEASSLQQDPPRSPCSSDTSTAEEQEAFPRLRAGHRRKWPPRRAVDPGWKEATLGALRSCKAAPCAVGRRADSVAGDQLASLVQLEEGIRERQQDFELEEEKLLQKKAQIREADLSLYSILPQKECVAQELETFQEDFKENQKEARRPEPILGEARYLGSSRVKRVASLRELQELEKEPGVLWRPCGCYVAAQEEVSRLVTEWEGLKEQVRCLEEQLLSLEHQLASAKVERSSLEEAASTRTEQLQAVLLEKELALSRLRGTVPALEAAKQAQDTAVESLREEHRRQLEALHKEKAKELLELREVLQHEKQEVLQELAESKEQAKADALWEQASTFKKEIEHLGKIIEERDAELVQQREALQQQAKELRQEAKETVRNSLLREQKKWEAETRAALQEQEQRAREELQEALEKERQSSRGLQDQTSSLREKIQELQCQAHSSQRDKQAAMGELRAVLQEEKAEALRQLRDELEQERMQEREQLRAKLRQMEDQSKAAFLAQVHAHSLARGISLACQRLQDLLPKKAGTPMLHGSLAPSSSCALQALHALCEEMQHYLQDLKHEAELLRQEVLQIQREKEHMRDIATLQRSWLKEARLKEDLVLCQPLQEKGGELWALQRSWALWKDAMSSELEKCLSGDKPSDSHRDLVTPESEIRRLSMGWSKCLHPHPVRSPSLNGACFSSKCRFSTPKLLHHLQSRIRELQAENAVFFRGGPGSLSSFREHLDETSRNRRHPTLELSSSLLHGTSSWK